MAKLQKRSGMPFGMTVVSIPSPAGSKCGACGDVGKKRFQNSWRAMDVCSKPLCNQQGAAWTGNSPFSKRSNDPPRIWREPVPTKYLSRKADAVAKPPGARARGAR